MEDLPATFTVVTLSLLAVLLWHRWNIDPLKAIPTCGGPSLPGLSFYGAISFARRGNELLVEGYERYRNGTFRVALFDKWIIVVSGASLVEDIRQRSEEVLSAPGGTSEILQLKHVAGPDIVEDPQDVVDIVNKNLARSLPNILPAIVEEVHLWMEGNMPNDSKVWTSIDTSHLMRNVVFRSTSRLFVGIPLCRDEGYTSLMDAYDLEYSWTVAALTLVPKPLKPIAVRFVNRVQPVVQKGLQILEPIIEERKAHMDECGDDWCDKPTDILQAILDRTVPRKASNVHVAGRLFSIGFGATHTSLSHALHHVALYPEIVEHLRAEIRDVIGEGGWTWPAVGRLEKLDSFLKESQRYACIVPLSMIRKAMADVWLQDGTFIPKGTLVAAAAGATHLDDSLYPNPYTFDAFRFFRVRKADLETSSRHQFTASSHTYLPFGHGLHACPGRFYAAMQMKVILSYIITNFDLQLSTNPRPRNLGLLFVPNRLGSGEILFRKR